MLLLQPIAPQTRSKTNNNRNDHTASPQIVRGEHDTPARVQVLQLRNEGFNALKIREKTGVPERTQRRFATIGPRRPSKVRHGRTNKLSGDILDRIIKDFAGQYKIRKLDYESQIRQ
jgi:hypothetical protein